jgi:hypothetical protein
MTAYSRTTAPPILSIVTGLMKAGTMFTAFDVYRLVRDATPVGSIRPKYHEIKTTIEQTISDLSISPFDTYTRSLASFIGSNGNQPWVYHPSAADPSGYNPTVDQATPVPQTTTAAAKAGDTVVTADGDSPTGMALADVPLPELLAELGYRLGTALLALDLEIEDDEN